MGSTDSSLLRRAQVQDQDAWNTLVRLYGPLVYHWCRQSGLAEPDQADVFQEVFRSAAAGLDGFRRNEPGQTFRGWLRTIARNRIVDHIRRQKYQPEAVGGSDAQRRIAELPDTVKLPGPNESDDEYATTDFETVRLARQAMDLIKDRFEPNTWKAFWRTAIDGQSATAAAEELGMTAAGVRKAKSRVLRRLKEEFGHLLD
jgi:RNA polymerase sigma-70 factor (ECF subfamily)